MGLSEYERQTLLDRGIRFWIDSDGAIPIGNDWEEQECLHPYHIVRVLPVYVIAVHNVRSRESVYSIAMHLSTPPGQAPGQLVVVTTVN